MQLRNSAEQYGAIAQSVHWLTVIAVLLAWPLGQFHDAVPRGAARALGMFIHNSAGLTVMLLLVFRLLWRWIDAPPRLHTVLGAWVEHAARVSHLVLYLLLAAVPIAGIVLQFARGEAVPIFGVVEIASPWARDRVFARSAREVHEFLANAVLVLAFLHAGAALLHHWVLRDTTLRRMLPRAVRRSVRF